MDISSATTAQVSTTTDTSASAKTQQTSKGDSSFKDEMSKVSSKDESNVKTKTETNAKEQNFDKAVVAEESAVAVKTDENQNNTKSSIVIKQPDSHPDLSAAAVLSGSIDMTANIQNINTNILNDTQALIDANMQLCEVVSDAKIPSKVDYTTVQMDMNDTKFFTDLVQNTDKTIQNVMTEISQNAETEVQEVQKNVKVSATLMNALSEAVKNKQSFRIDFDKDISVIIRVDKEGSLSAKFIPGDSAVEQYLRQNISTLRQRFDDQELPYKELSYTGQQKRERKNDENNKEKQS